MILLYGIKCINSINVNKTSPISEFRFMSRKKWVLLYIKFLYNRICSNGNKKIIYKIYFLKHLNFIVTKIPIV